MDDLYGGPVAVAIRFLLSLAAQACGAREISYVSFWHDFTILDSLLSTRARRSSHALLRVKRGGVGVRAKTQGFHSNLSQRAELGAHGLHEDRKVGHAPLLGE